MIVRTFKILVFGALAALVALVIAVVIAMASLPGYDELKSSPNGQMVRVRAADGTVLISLGPSYGQWIPFAKIPAVMVDAMVATEDRRFYMHPGVDPIGIARSGMVRVERGRWAQGGSTITQQLTRNIFLSNTRTFARKFREIILELAMERKFSKQQILELYLNRVYFGGGAYGIDAAARKFFGHDADHFTLGEAAIIAGLVKAPSNYSPTADAAAAVGRAKVVIALMRAQGKVSAAEEAEADPATVALAPEPKQNSVRYFTDWALAQLDTLVDETSAPIDVWTTLDLGMQRAADAAIRQNTPPGAQGRWSRWIAGARCARWWAARIMSRPYTTARRRRCGSRDRRSSCSSISPRWRRATSPRIAWWTSRSTYRAGVRATAAVATPARWISAPPSPSRSHRRRQAGRGGWASIRWRTWRAASASPRRWIRIPRWCSAPATCG